MTTIRDLAQTTRTPVEQVMGLFNRAGVDVSASVQIVTDSDINALERYAARLAMSRVAERDQIAGALQ